MSCKEIFEKLVAQIKNSKTLPRKKLQALKFDQFFLLKTIINQLFFLWNLFVSGYDAKKYLENWLQKPKLFFFLSKFKFLKKVIIQLFSLEFI